MKDLITDLTPWEGKNIRFTIKAYDSEGDEVWIPDDEILMVKNGRLYASSYRSGIIEWCEKDETYKKYYHHSVRPIDIVGFTNVEEDEY